MIVCTIGSFVKTFVLGAFIGGVIVAFTIIGLEVAAKRWRKP